MSKKEYSDDKETIHDIRYGAVIVAAGLSSRMKEFKPLKELNGIAMVNWVVLNFKRCGIQDIVLVTGYQAELLEQKVKKWGVVCIRNQDFQTTQMLDSAKMGFAYLQNFCDKLFLCPVDIPLFTEGTVAKMMDRKQDLLVVPVCDGKKGHPIMLDVSLVPKILAFQGEDGLRGALAGTSETVVDVADRGILMDADTQEDFAELVKLQERRMLHPQVQIRLAKQEVFFGPGTARLLRQIAYVRSVRDACKRLNLSYSKGREMLNFLESELGRCVVERKQGGKYGGEAELTEYGKWFLGQYEQLEREMTMTVESRYKEIFGNRIFF